LKPERHLVVNVPKLLKVDKQDEGGAVSGLRIKP
jgi:hypothetical protein